MKSLNATLLVLIFIVSTIFVVSPSFASEEEGGSVYSYEITDITQTAPDTIVVTARCRFCSACNPNDPGWPDRGIGCTPFACGYPPASFPSYASCQMGSPDGRYAAIRLTGTFGSVLQKLICDQSNWPLNSLWSHNFIFSGLTLQPGETITVEADFYCSYCRHWYATPQTFVPQMYTFVFIPFHWDGSLGSNTPGSETGFYEEVKDQKELIIDNVGVLTDANTRVIPVGENLIFPQHTYWRWWPLPPRFVTITFSETDFSQAADYMHIFGWGHMVTFASDHGATGDRYIAITNREMWGLVEGWSNMGATVISEDDDDFTVLHELGHSWGLLDEYQYHQHGDIPGWYEEARLMYNYDNFQAWTSTGHPPNSYPGDDTPGTDWSNGRQFDSQRCIMGPADPSAGGRGFCQAHPWDDPNRNEQGAPRAYEGCFAHVDESINRDMGITSAGLVSTIITFYKDQSIQPEIKQITGLPIVGKPLQYFGFGNYSFQVFSEEGSQIYNSNITLSFMDALHQYSPGLDQGPSADVVTVHWLAPMFSETCVTVELTDNVANQIIISQTVEITPVAEAWIDYKTTDKNSYNFGETIEVATEINTTHPSMSVVLDVTLLDPTSIAQDYRSWIGTIYPTPDPVTLYLSIPSSGIAGTWTVYVAVLNSTGQLQDSKTNLITIGGDTTPPVTTLTISSPKYVDALGNVYITSSTMLTLDAIDDGGTGSGVALTGYRAYDTSFDSGRITGSPPLTFQIGGLNDGLYYIDYNSTDNAANAESTNTQAVVLDNTAPEITVSNPPAGWALQDGATFLGSITDAGSGVFSMSFSIREQDGGTGTQIGYDDLPVSYDPATGVWSFSFDTLLVPDGYYILYIEAEDNLGNENSTTVPYSIRNWAVIELLPSSSRNKAGRTIPIKFALRVAAEVDPAQPFVYNEELRIDIFATADPDSILQESYYGDSARDYRISSMLYITNFKTIKRTPKEYTVAIYRESFDVGSFTFETVK